MADQAEGKLNNNNYNDDDDDGHLGWVSLSWLRWLGCSLFRFFRTNSEVKDDHWRGKTMTSRPCVSPFAPHLGTVMFTRSQSPGPK